jgi:Flp pilus assembly protein TadG
MLALIRRRFTRSADRAPVRCGRRFGRSEDGGVAVEFAIVAVPFLALLFAILETAIVFFAGQLLETAVADSARLIMTGQAQTKGFNQAQFKQEVCARIYGLFDCANGISIDVKTYQDFASVAMANPVDQDGKFVDTNFTYTPGGPGDIVVVRLFYKWPVYFSLLGFNLADLAGGQRLLVGTAAFRNEPYE